jgi:hypothetical protein
MGSYPSEPPGSCGICRSWGVIGGFGDGASHYVRCLGGDVEASMCLSSGDQCGMQGKVHRK